MLKKIYLVTTCLLSGALLITHNVNAQLGGPPPLDLSYTVSDYNGSNVSCFGAQDGYIDLTVLNGTPPYSYRWNNNARTQDISGLPAGSYSVVVTDTNGAAGIMEVFLISTEPLTIGEMIPYVYSNGFNVSAFGACNGSITTTVEGGVIPYSYRWEPGQQTVLAPTNLCANENVLIVTDANGCETNSGVALSEPERDDWTMSGNNNTNPATQFIGTLDNKDLNFRTNNVERFKIKSNGDIKIPSLASNTIIYSSVLADSLGNLFVSKYKTTCLPAWSSDLVRNTITAHCPNSNIKVGIGTRYPIFDFEVFKETSLNDNVKMKCQTQTANNAEMWTINTNGSFAFATDANGKGQIYRDVMSPTPIITFDNQGKVGIGVEPPVYSGIGTNYLLYVENGIATRDVKVTINNFPDYVFARDYKLMSLYELEQFIKTNSRLPEMPSAKEVEKNNGYELGSVVTILVKQNEKQALYLITQQKQIDELKEEIKLLKRRK